MQMPFDCVLTQKEAKSFSDSDADVEQLVVELLESRVIVIWQKKQIP